MYAHILFPTFSLIPEAPVHLSCISYQCEACMKTGTTKPAPPHYGTIRTSRVGELIHSDLYSPMPTEGIGKQKYMCTLVDDYSRLMMAKAIYAKSDAVAALKEMMIHFESFTTAHITALRTDVGGEFKSNGFRVWLKKGGTAEKPTDPYHSETNSMAERANRTTIATVRTCIHIQKVCSHTLSNIQYLRRTGSLIEACL